MKKLNTKNCCFLCLQSSKIKIEDRNENSESALHPIRKNQSLLRCLVRHLQINLNGSKTVQSNSNIPSRDDTDVEVDLCEDCAQLNSGFSKLLLQWEKIRMEMDFYLGRIHHRLLESSKNAELVQNYSKEMTSDRETLAQLAFVDKLWKEIAEKSSKLASVNPTVYLTATELAKLNITVKQEGKEIEALDDFEVQNSDGRSPTFEDSPEQLDVDLSSELKPEVTCEIQKGKTRDPSKVEKCYSRNLSTGKYHCIICSKPFRCSYKVRLHHDAIHLKKTFNCEGCSSSYSEEGLRRHKKICKGKAFVGNKKINVYYVKNKVTGLLHCTKCEKPYRFRKSIVFHYETVHLQKRYKCDICNIKEFAHLHSLKYHKKKCKETFEDLLIKKTNGEQFVCKLCGKWFPTRIKLGVHRRKVHLNADRYACDLCEKKFKSQANLNIHRDKAHFGKRFECGFCRKNCSNIFVQKRHERECPRKNVKIEQKD